jgi:hypothetical protein
MISRVHARARKAVSVRSHFACLSQNLVSLGQGLARGNSYNFCGGVMRRWRAQILAPGVGLGRPLKECAAGRDQTNNATSHQTNN